MADTRIYRHPKRPEWGMAIASEYIDDRVRFVFEDAQIRAFKADLLHVLEVVDMPEAEAATLRGKLNRKKPSPATLKKKAKLAAAAKKPVASTPSDAADDSE